MLGQQQVNSSLYEDAIASFTAAGEHEGAAAALESAAVALAGLCESNGDLDAARVLVSRTELPEAAREKALALLMAEGKRLEDSGEHEQAAQWYQTLSGLGNADELVKASSYKAALKQMQAGEYLAAANAFAALGDYSDAALQAQSCYDSVYSGILAQAKTLFDAKDHLGLITLLQPIDRSTLPKSYEAIEDMYLETCLTVANDLYSAGERYKALPFYMEASELSAAEKKLGYRSYLILGTWQSNSGKLAEFRPDGTCTLMGEELYFQVDNFSLLTGTAPDDLSVTHRINSMTAKGMSIEELRGSGEVNFKLEKIAEVTIPQLDLSVLAEDAKEPAPETEQQGGETAAPETEQPPVTEESNEA